MSQCDRDIMRRLRERDPDAFEELHGLYALEVRSHVARMVRDAATADDLAQEVFLRAWTHGAQWDGRGTVRGWLLRIATNLTLNHLRSTRRRRRQSLQPQPHAHLDEADEDAVPGWMIDRAALGPDAVLEQAEAAERLRRAVADLPEGKREVLRLVYDEDMDVQGAADVLGIPPGTVKSRLYHARRSLNERLRPEREDKR